MCARGKQAWTLTDLEYTEKYLWIEDPEECWDGNLTTKKEENVGTEYEEK